MRFYRLGSEKNLAIEVVQTKRRVLQTRWVTSKTGT